MCARFGEAILAVATLGHNGCGYCPISVTFYVVFPLDVPAKRNSLITCVESVVNQGCALRCGDAPQDVQAIRPFAEASYFTCLNSMLVLRRRLVVLQTAESMPVPPFVSRLENVHSNVR